MGGNDFVDGFFVLYPHERARPVMSIRVTPIEDAAGREFGVDIDLIWQYCESDIPGAAKLPHAIAI